MSRYRVHHNGTEVQRVLLYIDKTLASKLVNATSQHSLQVGHNNAPRFVECSDKRNPDQEAALLHHDVTEAHARFYSRLRQYSADFRHLNHRMRRRLPGPDLVRSLTPKTWSRKHACSSVFDLYGLECRQGVCKSRGLWSNPRTPLLLGRSDLFQKEVQMQTTPRPT